MFVKIYIQRDLLYNNIDCREHFLTYKKKYYRIVLCSCYFMFLLLSDLDINLAHFVLVTFHGNLCQVSIAGQFFGINLVNFTTKFIPWFTVFTLVYSFYLGLQFIPLEK